MDNVFKNRLIAYANCSDRKATRLIKDAALKFPGNIAAYRFCIKEEAYCLKHKIKKTKKAKKPVEPADEEEEETGSIQCRKCLSYNVQTFERQTRGADEPATIFAHCMKCNKSFRMG